jgi:hypothetical protein
MYGTFGYRRISFGLCNAPAIFLEHRDENFFGLDKKYNEGVQ